MYNVIFTKQAEKDASKIEQAGLKPKAVEIIQTVRNNPYENSQEFEKLTGDFKGAYSRRINRKHRFIYEIFPNIEKLKNADGEQYTGIIKVISMWTHYE
jgi:Txe/YoeB family toxin of toxin-antitoxin system